MSQDLFLISHYFHTGNELVVPLVKAMGKRISALAEDEQRS